MEKLVHHHLIYQAKVGRADLGEDAESVLRDFLYNLVKEINMNVLIDPVLKFSYKEAWTGLIGIVTSHISFHYWKKERYVQLDIYSCKEFDIEKAKAFLDKFWVASEQKILFINRQFGKDFVVEKIT
ncbi:MAG: S-adenosylmethionine decarboxylase [Minisyncoccia bacterium]